MNELTPTGAPLTMSSREIADLTGSSHDNVLKTVRALVARGVVSGNETPYLHPQNGQQYAEFLLDYRNTMVVVSGYSPELRAKIVDRWIELEEAIRRPALPDLSDPVLLSQLLLEHTSKRIEAENRARDAERQVEEMQPKVVAHDRLAEAHGSVCRSTAAKNLGVPPQVLIRWMRTNSWTFRRLGDKDDLAYQSKISAGLLEHKVETGQRPDGSEWVRTQVRVTAKGMLALAKAFPPAAAAA